MIAACRARLPVLTVALLTAVVAAPARAQLIDIETWAQLVVDHPLERTGDVDGLLGSWLELIDEEPDHALVEGTLRLLRARFDELLQPQGLVPRLLALDGTDLLPAARRELALLSAEIRLRFAPIGELTGEPGGGLWGGLFHGYLGRYLVLGPLPPLGDPRGAGNDTPLWHEPRLQDVHEGSDGQVTWVAGDRTATRRFVRPQGVAYPGNGYVMTAAHFTIPAGGPAWLEIEVARETRARGSSNWAFALNEQTPRLVDETASERPSRTLFPVSLRTGLNRLMLRSSMDAPVEFSVRILAEDGDLYPGLIESDGSAPLGMPPPPGPALGPLPVALAGSEAALAALAVREPHAEALLGWLAVLDGRQAEGLVHVRAAVAATPGSAGLMALLARLTADADYLPEVWRRGRARELAETVLAIDPTRLDMGLAVADILSGEDREEDALALLGQLTEAHGQQVASLLARRRVHLELGMEAEAEADLELALERAPTDGRVLSRLADHLDAVGQHTRSLEARERLVRSAGATPARLLRLAQAAGELGQLELAREVYAEAELRAGGRGYQPDLVSLLSAAGQLAAADEVLARLTALYPRWARLRVDRADIALLAGDREAELQHLRAALALSPAWRAVRERLEELTGEHETRRLQERFGVDREAALALYADGAFSDSVVRILDSAVVQVFPDGSIETLTRNLLQVRDLAGCEAQGTQRLGGDVLSVVTIKPDGRQFEPVEVDGDYVMPSLEPGDLIETVTRRITNRPGDRIARPGSWTFASLDEPFVLSRYVISIPRELSLRLVQRNFSGTHEVHELPSSVVHVFEQRNSARVLPEPAMPPPHWFLPSVEFGGDRDLEASLAWLTHETILPRRVTPEIVEQARQIVAGSNGQEASARALFDFVAGHLDQRQERSGVSATAALLMREGNPVYLYSALLAAARIPHDVAWSRDISPEGDPEPEPAFLDGGYWRNKLLVRVRPDDGPVAWCDLDSRTMPYGRLMDHEPGAPVYLVDSGERSELPRVPLERRGPGLHLDLQLDLDAHLDAAVQARVELVGGLAFVAKENVREVPETHLKLAVGATAGQVIPRIDVSSYELAGLHDDQPLSAAVSGTIAAFLDDDGSQLSCRLPFPALELGSKFAGEGNRRLPFFLSSSIVHSARATLRLPDGLELVEPPRGLSENFRGARYTLTVEPDGNGAWTVRRDVAAPPMVLPAEDFDAFRELCARIDEAERARLRFARR